jgi:hypothetical protein
MGCGPGWSKYHSPKKKKKNCRVRPPYHHNHVPKHLTDTNNRHTQIIIYPKQETLKPDSQFAADNVFSLLPCFIVIFNLHCILFLITFLVSWHIITYLLLLLPLTRSHSTCWVLLAEFRQDTLCMLVSVCFHNLVTRTETAGSL